MGTEITFRRGSTDPTSGSGLTLAEPAFNTTLKTFHIGLGHGVTAAWVGAPISGLSADIAAGITYKIPTLAAVKNYVTGTSITNYVSSFNGLTGAVTGVSSFNGATGAVTGASLGANTFTGTQTLTAGLTTSYLYSSGGSTFASTLQVNGGATFSGRTDFAGSNNFATGLSAAGTLNTTSNIKFNGTAAKSIRTTQAPLTITGITSGVALGSSNSVVFGVQATDPLKLYSATGVVEINQDNLINPYTTSIKLFTLDNSETNASVNIVPTTYFTADRTLSIQDASGTIALTSQLMGTVNGSTAATTAVTSFNGRTGAVQGVSAAVAGDGIAVSGATGAVTITNTGVTRAVAGTGISVSGATGSVTITNIGVQSFNGNTGSVQGVSAAIAGTGISVSGATGSVTITNTGVQSFNGNTGSVTGASLGANTFTGLNTFSAGITTAYIYASNGSTFGGTLQVNGGATFSGTVNGATATFNRLLTASGGISASGGMTLDGGTVWHSRNDGITSGLDAGLVHGVCGSRFLENLQTGLLYGGLISVNAGNTAQVDISAGAGIVVSPGASLSAYPIPTVTPVTWAAKTGVTLSGLTSSDETWLAIDTSGNLVQTNVAFTDAQYSSQIPLGAALHLSRTYIQLVKVYPHVSYAQPEQFDPFIRAFGNLKLSGHEVTANGANLNVNRSAGKAYAMGRNYKNDPNNPNIVTDTNATPVSTIYRFYRDGSGAFTTVINSTVDPTKYDDGTGTLATTTPAKFTIQRLFYLPNEPSLLGVYYGRQEYNSISDAQANIPFESFSESESSATQGVFCGWLIVRGNATLLNDTAEAKFVNAGLFRNTSNIGGGGLAIASIDDLSDVTTTTPSNNQVLRWNSGTAQWVNSDVSSLAVSSFNGLTGAVQGVCAAIGSTYLTVSGSTGSVTFTNTGVQTFNGLTGAVTGVTVGGANTFTALNTFNAGITTAYIYASNGSTFGGTLQVNGGATFAATANFTNGLTSSGSIQFRGTTQKNIRSTQAPIFIQGITSGTAASYNSITLPVNTSALLLGSASGNVNIVNNNSTAAVPGLRILTDDQDFIGSFGTVIKPISYATAERTQTLQDASGTLALTSQLMGTVNGSTAATTAVTSFNGLTGAVTGASLGANTFTALNSFNAGISAAGGVTFAGTFSGATGSFSRLLTASEGISAAGGVTFAGNVTAKSTLYTDTIQAIGTQINIANVASGRIAFGDFDSNGNSTFVFIRDSTSTLYISNPFGNVSIGDPNNVDSGYALVYNSAAGYLDGGNSSLTNFSTGSFSGLLTASAGISAAGGVTFAGTFSGATGSFSKLLTTSAGISAAGTTAANFNGLVDMSFNTLFEPTLRYYNEVLASPAISANVLTLDLSTAQMFTVSLNANITTLTISNTPATANRSIGFTLIFTADGTARSVTWGAAVKWANNDPPALTSTNGKKDILSFVSPDGGTNWYGFIGGLNF